MSIPVRVAMVAPATVLAPYWAAQSTGRFAAAGIEIETQVTGSTEKTTDLLLQGKADIAIGAADAALEHPDDVTILAGLADRPPLSLVARPDITSIEQLRGSSIGTTSLREGTAQLIAAILGDYGMQFPGDYTFVRAGAHPQRWQALQDGVIDAALQLMPYDQIAQDAGFTVLTHAEDHIPYFAFGSILARAGWLADDPTLAHAFSTALHSGEQLVRSDRDRAAAIVDEHARVGPKYAAGCIDRLLDRGVMPSGLVHSTAALDRLRQTIAGSAAFAQLPFGSADC